MKRSVFISHSSEDKSIAERVCAYLEKNGVLCWIAPRDVTPGKNYGVAILDAIDECRVFVLILSSYSNESRQVVREVERAASSDSIILPFRVEDVQPARNIAFYVSAAHWLDATEKPVESHFDELLTAIRNWEKTEESPGVPPPPPIAVTPSGTLPAGPRPWPLLIISAVGAVIILAGLTYMFTRFFQPRTAKPFVSPSEMSPAATATLPPSMEPSATAAAPAISPPSLEENPSPSLMPPPGRRKPGEPLHSPIVAEPPPTSATPIPSRLRPGQRLISPTPAASPTPLSGTLNVPVVREVAASSYLNDRTRPNLAFDGDPATAWMSKSHAIEQSIIVHFKSPVLIRSVSILNGDARDEEHYRLCSRARTLRMILSDGATQMLTFEDVLKIQRFDLTRPTTVDWIKFEIVSVFRGSKSNRAGISEITFNQPAP
ncbi:MAG: hypothetical protein QOG67_1368 [Verrucomicrobiota bacterium]|jgi:hypothetical protein